MEESLQKVDWLRRLLALGGLALFSVTWRLWMPQTVYPQIPLFAWAGRIPVPIEWTLLIVSIGGLLVMLFAPMGALYWKYGAASFALSVSTLFLIDQHRIQPWAYQIALFSLLAAIAPARLAITLLRWLTISIYAHSALSKLDYSFLDTHGQQLANGIFQNFGQSIEPWPESSRRFLAAMLPMGELLVAVGLCWRRTQSVALCFAIMMHVALMLAVGPWGLNHKPGVLVWNAFFVTLIVLLFGTARSRSRLLAAESVATPEPIKTTCPLVWLATIMSFAAISLPFLEPYGLFDHWPSWGLYASRPERVQLYVSKSERNRMPPDLASLIDDPQFGFDWCRLRIDDWSLRMLEAPAYPQERFRLGVALAVAENFELNDNVLVVIESAADRWTGERSIRRVLGVQGIRAETRRFRLNAEPRGRWNPRDSAR